MARVRGLPGGRMVVVDHGAPPGFADAVASEVEAAYRACGRAPDYLELHVYGSRAAMEAALDP